MKAQKILLSALVLFLWIQTVQAQKSVFQEIYSDYLLGRLDEAKSKIDNLSLFKEGVELKGQYLLLKGEIYLAVAEKGESYDAELLKEGFRALNIVAYGGVKASKNEKERALKSKRTAVDKIKKEVERLYALNSYTAAEKSQFFDLSYILHNSYKEIYHPALAKASMELEKWDDAIRYFKESIEQNKGENFYNIYYKQQIAQAYSLKGDSMKTKEYMELTVKDIDGAIDVSEKKDTLWRNAKVRMLVMLDRKEEAIHEGLIFLAQNPKNRILANIMKEIWGEEETVEFIKEVTYPDPKGLSMKVTNIHETDIYVKAGDLVKIIAKGKVRYGMFAGVGGPKGINGFQSYNLIRAKTHGGLYAMVDKSYEAVGDEIELVSSKSGKLTLFINDNDYGNNAGYFEAIIYVNRKQQFPKYSTAPPKPDYTRMMITDIMTGLLLGNSRDPSCICDGSGLTYTKHDTYTCPVHWKY